MNDNTDFEIQRALGRLEEAVKQLTREVSESRQTISHQITDMETRITILESWRVYIIAFGAGIIMTITALGVFLWRFFSVFSPHLTTVTK